MSGSVIVEEATAINLTSHFAETKISYLLLFVVGQSVNTRSCRVRHQRRVQVRSITIILINPSRCPSRHGGQIISVGAVG